MCDRKGGKEQVRKKRNEQRVNATSNKTKCNTSSSNKSIDCDFDCDSNDGRDGMNTKRLHYNGLKSQTTTIQFNRHLASFGVNDKCMIYKSASKFDSRTNEIV